MTETMVEKVGLAIRVARWEWVTANAGKSPEWPHVPIDVLARAAIEAMREPSTTMVDAGVAYALNVSIHGEGGWSRYVEAKYRAMIDAALSEPSIRERRAQVLSDLAALDGETMD